MPDLFARLIQLCSCIDVPMLVSHSACQSMMSQWNPWAMLVSSWFHVLQKKIRGSIEILINPNHCWLIPHYILVGVLEHFLFFHILGNSSSQLTNSYFFRWVGQPPTSNYCVFNDASHHYHSNFHPADGCVWGNVKCDGHRNFAAVYS